jgi:hypothetical protein
MMMDTQMIEILGRNHLVNELLRAGLEVAEPARDRGVDLLVYADLKEQSKTFRAIPLQLKASSKEVFSIDKKYEKFSELLIVFVWNLQTANETTTYALTYSESKKVAEQMGWTETKSWNKGIYSTTRPSERLKKLLVPYKMSMESWQRKVIKKTNS